MHGSSRHAKSGTSQAVPQVSKATAVRLVGMGACGLLLLVLLMAFGPGMDSDVPVPVTVVAGANTNNNAVSAQGGGGAIIPTPVPGARRSTLRGSRNAGAVATSSPTPRPAPPHDHDNDDAVHTDAADQQPANSKPHATAATATQASLADDSDHGDAHDASTLRATRASVHTPPASPSTPLRVEPTTVATAAAAAAVVVSEEELEAAAAAPVATTVKATKGSKVVAVGTSTSTELSEQAPATDETELAGLGRKKKQSAPKTTTAASGDDDGDAAVAIPPPPSTVKAVDHDSDADAAGGENTAPWSELPPNAPAVAPCLVTHCARKQYTQFKHYQLCDSVVGAMKDLQLNSSEHDLINATRLTYTPGEGQTRRTPAEIAMDKKCDPSHGKYGPSLLRPGMRSEAPSRSTIEACVDPRYPLRMPLAVHRLNSGPALTCYARGDMVCDIVGRSGGWEGELMQMLDSALGSIRRHRLDQLLKARENAYERLSARPGVAREAVAKAVQEKSPFFKAATGHRASIKKREEAIAAKRAADEAGTKVKPGAHSDGGLRTTVKPAHRLSTNARRFSQFFATFGLSALERGAFPLNASRDVAPPSPQDKQPNSFVNRNLGSFNPGGSNALYAEHGVYYGETAIDPADRARANFDVEYVDIGANVGAFLLHFWRHGFPVTAFEALPFNMQLLSSSLCLNGIRAPILRSEELTSSGDPGWEGTRKLSKLPFNMTKAMAQEAAKFAKFMRSRARLESRQGSAAIKQSKLAPGVVIYHTALGRERDVRCVMMSEDLNFGDTWISCNATHVAHTASEFPFQQYRRRGYVNMTTLDSFILPPPPQQQKQTQSRGPSKKKMSHDAATRNMMVDLVRREVAAVVKAVLPEDEAASDAAVNATVAQVFNAKTDLPSNFFEKDYIAKIDVEGHEISVVEGAPQLLKNKSVRPRMWLSEVWRTLNITRYAEIMMGDAGYVGLVPLQSRWLMTVADATEYHRTMKDDMDTVIWVEPEYATLLNRAHALSYPKADAIEKLRQISNDLKAKRVAEMAADTATGTVSTMPAATATAAADGDDSAAAPSSKKQEATKKKKTSPADAADVEAVDATAVPSTGDAAVDAEDTSRSAPPVSRKAKKVPAAMPADGDDESPAATKAAAVADTDADAEVLTKPRKAKKSRKPVTQEAEEGHAATAAAAAAEEEEEEPVTRLRAKKKKKVKVAAPTSSPPQPASADKDTHDEPVEE